MLDIGKLPNDMLEKILKQFSKPMREEVLSKPVIGEDCAVLDFSGDLCVVTTDPITGAEDDLGTLAVHVACNDLASAGAYPVGLMVTLLAPPTASFGQLHLIMNQVKTEADKIKADIIGGHTEVTDAVNRIIINIAALGRVKKGAVVTTSGAQFGDDIILTKYAATEGTVILANLFEKELISKIGVERVTLAKGLIGSVSVLNEGLIAARFGVSSMHDVTEGGVLGAVWELCSASECGAEIIKASIPLMAETELICSCLDIDPLKLISSGSMLITCHNGHGLIELLSKNDIKANIIGKITTSGECLMIDDNKVVKIIQPESDELYKARKVAGRFF